MTQSFVGASEVAVEAIQAASEPMLSKLSGVVDAASKAEGKLRAAVALFGWKWIAVWWQRHQVGDLTEQRATLQAEVVQLQANVDEWAKRAGRAKLTTCGSNDGSHSRLCVRVDTKAGAFGTESDHMILKGY